LFVTFPHKQLVMDKPSTDRNMSAKRRCPNYRESDTLFMTRSPEPTTPNDSPIIEEPLDNDHDDEFGSEPDESMYDESQEPFPAYPAFDPRVGYVKTEAESLVKNLDSLLGQFASVNKDLGNMKAKSAEVMKAKPTRRLRIGLMGGTGAGKWTCIAILTNLLTNLLTRNRQECPNQLSH
jgi:hypothetical protein